MTLTTHILTAAAIGKNVDSSWLAACLPFVFHFILDAFRHGEYVSEKSHWSEFWKVAVDFCFGMAILFLLTLASPISDIQAKNIALAVVFSILPDIATLF